MGYTRAEVEASSWRAEFYASGGPFYPTQFFKAADECFIEHGQCACPHLVNAFGPWFFDLTNVDDATAICDQDSWECFTACTMGYNTASDQKAGAHALTQC